MPEVAGALAVLDACVAVVEGAVVVSGCVKVLVTAEDEGAGDAAPVFEQENTAGPGIV